MDSKRLIRGVGTRSDGFRNEVAAYVRDQARILEEARPGATLAQKRHVATLREFADYLGRLPLEDQRLRTLELFSQQGPIQKFQGEYTPGGEQAKLIAQFGLDGDPPPMPDAMEELVAWAAADFANSFHVARSAATRELDDLRRIRDKHERAVEDAARFENEAITLRERLAEKEQESGKLRERVDFLSLLQPEAAADADAEEAKSRDRKRVDDHPNIYSRVSANGTTVYSVRYPEEKGGFHWKTTGPELADAIAFRDEKQGVTANVA